jgi:hypothetical protein
LLIALPIIFLHHPLPGNQTETSVRFGCALPYMSTKSYTFIPYRLRDHNVQSPTKSFFPLRPRGTAVFRRPKKPFLDIDMGCRTSYSCSYLS